MMKRLLFIFAWLLLTISITVGITHAQNQGNKPRILSFTSDTAEVTPDQAESGEYQITLYWETEHLTEGFRLDVQTWVLGEWQSTVAEGETLPAAGWELHTVPHTLDFQPPVWRLVILDTKGAIVDQRLLKLRYSETPAGEPTIISFSAPATIPALGLTERMVTIPVEWHIINRPPNSNLRFTQLIDNGQRWQSVELPRPFMWIRSQGEGLVRPYYEGSRTLNIRLELYDTASDTVYASAFVTVEALGEFSLPTPVPSPTFAPTQTTVSIDPACPEFFFEVQGANYYYAGGGVLNGELFTLCPSGDVTITPGLLQIFENGYMLYRADTNSVYILSNNAFAVTVPNNYVEGEPVSLPIIPVPGSPEVPSIFKKVYADHYDITQFLGWAVADAEAYDLQWQETLGGEPMGVVMSLPNGGRLFATYSPYGDGNNPPVWAFINRDN